MTRYFKIPAEQSAAIVADAETVRVANFALFTRLAGVPIKQITRVGNFAFGFAYVKAIVTEVPPTEPGWQARKDEPNHYVPAKRKKAGRALAEQLRGLDVLGIFSALERAGVSPFWHNPNHGKGGHAGVDPTGDEMLLTWDGKAPAPSWPEWVQEIKGSEYHAILEARAALPTSEPQ
ncbi:hypothetical protein [Deinococcus sp. Leaf326]|uniref:hypothetical protein n=1 Tax=Deinococcus sp. Leaf326 TaxID=1736338 RepID=UPI0006F8A32F|nr:hypothetical protein [Deinococcus sp. Leaf326]KQR22893.1 hypothetical protein ASF71_06920 [Deinococcus sp. Leaf326]